MNPPPRSAPMPPAALAELRRRAAHRSTLVRAFLKAQPRRFSGEPISGFGELAPARTQPDEGVSL